MSEQDCFLVRGCNFAPDGYIKLGQIIANPESPEIALCKPLNPPEVEESTQHDWELESQKTESASAGIWAWIPTIVPIGGRIGANAKTVNNTHWRCKTLDTHHFVPQEDYIQQSMNLPGVKKYCEQHQGKPVYMITGVKIARNATVKSGRTRGRGGNLSVGVDATGAGVPLTVGTDASGNAEEISKRGSSIPGPFVLAYQLLEISKKSKPGYQLLKGSKNPKTGHQQVKVSKNSKTEALTYKKHVDGSVKMMNAGHKDGESLEALPAKRNLPPRLQDNINGEGNEITESRSTRRRPRKRVSGAKPAATHGRPRKTAAQTMLSSMIIMEIRGSNILNKTDSNSLTIAFP